MEIDEHKECDKNLYSETDKHTLSAPGKYVRTFMPCLSLLAESTFCFILLARESKLCAGSHWVVDQTAVQG